MQIIYDKAKSKTLSKIPAYSLIPFSDGEFDLSKKPHFHINCKDVTGIQDFNFIIETNNPNFALSQSIYNLPCEWEGSIEVRDHKTMFPNVLPIIDYWRSPSRKSP
jgi:hypothetical protein